MLHIDLNKQRHVFVFYIIRGHAGFYNLQVHASITEPMTNLSIQCHAHDKKNNQKKLKVSP